MRNKKGSYIMEAAIVLPIIILVTITSILIIMFFFSQMTERCRLHVTLREEAGIMTERTIYMENNDNVRTDAVIDTRKNVLGGMVYGKKYLVMEHQGSLDKKGTFIVEGRCYGINGSKYVRYSNE